MFVTLVAFEAPLLACIFACCDKLDVEAVVLLFSFRISAAAKRGIMLVVEDGGCCTALEDSTSAILKKWKNLRSPPTESSLRSVIDTVVVLLFFSGTNDFRLFVAGLLYTENENRFSKNFKKLYDQWRPCQICFTATY